MAELGTKENPYTHHSQGGACYKHCKCIECDIVEKCTPNFDFYNSAYRYDDGLVCKNCFNSQMHSNKPTVRNINEN